MVSPLGKVYLVGAGPGDPRLLTRRGASLLATADSVVYDGLIDYEVLHLASPQARLIYAGKKRAADQPPMSQSEICRCLVDEAVAGRQVVRLKGGDPFVFGRGAEECDALAAAQIPYEIVPGVSAATAVPAYAGIPVTARGLSSSVAYATGHETPDKPNATIDWSALAKMETVVLFMALRTLRACCQRLLENGRSPDTPACAIYWGTTADQRVVTSTLAELPARVDEAALKPPVLFVVGPTVKLAESMRWLQSRPLHGRRILLTRSFARSQSYLDELQDAGAEVAIVPTTEVVPRTLDDAERDRLTKLDDYDWLVFASANAVRYFVEALFAQDLDLRALGRIRCAAIGPSTAAALRNFGIRADLVPNQHHATGLVEAFARQKTPAQRVLIPRAENGRTELLTGLRQGGTVVDSIAVYITRAAISDAAHVQRNLRRLCDNEFDSIVFFAPSQASALVQDLGSDAAAIINSTRTITAIGKTTGSELRRHRIRVDAIATAPTPSAVVKALTSHLSTQPEST